MRVSQESSPKIYTTLEKAIHDEDKEVVARASLALHANVDHQMAIKMGIIEPGETESGAEGILDSGVEQVQSACAEMAVSTGILELTLLRYEGTRRDLPNLVREASLAIDFVTNPLEGHDYKKPENL